MFGCDPTRILKPTINCAICSAKLLEKTQGFNAKITILISFVFKKASL